MPAGTQHHELGGGVWTFPARGEPGAKIRTALMRGGRSA